MNWVIRFSQPIRAVQDRIQAISGWAGTRRVVEEQGLVGIDAAGDQGGGHGVDVGAQLGRIVIDGDRVKIGEEDQAFATSSCSFTQRLIAPR